METGYPSGTATLVTFADGTTSLYFSNGGGVIGAGAHAAVRSASERLLATAEAQLADLEPATETPLPQVGRVRFYIRTFSGTLTAEAAEQALVSKHDRLSPLFHAGHGVITAIRLTSTRS
jgi:hypothetical protein